MLLYVSSIHNKLLKTVDSGYTSGFYVFWMKVVGLSVENEESSVKRVGLRS